MRVVPALILLPCLATAFLAGCGDSHRQTYYPVDEAPRSVAGPWTTRLLFVRKTPRELVLQIRVENTGDAPLVLPGGARVFRLQIADQILPADTLERTSWTLWGGTIAREDDRIRGGDLTVDGHSAREFELRFTFPAQLPGDDLPWILSAPGRSVDGRGEFLLAINWPVAVPPPAFRSPGVTGTTWRK